MILLDANIALRLADPTHVQHALAKAALTELKKRGEVFAIVPQTIYEFWVVATRPLAVNGLAFRSRRVKPKSPDSRRSRRFFLTSQPCTGNGSRWRSRINARENRRMMPDWWQPCGRMGFRESLRSIARISSVIPA